MSLFEPSRITSSRTESRCAALATFYANQVSRLQHERP